MRRICCMNYVLFMRLLMCIGKLNSSVLFSLMFQRSDSSIMYPVETDNTLLVSCLSNIIEEYGRGKNLMLNVNKDLGYDALLYSKQFVNAFFDVLPVFVYEMSDTFNLLAKSAVRYHQIHLIEYDGSTDLASLFNISRHGEIWTVNVKFIIIVRDFPEDQNKLFREMIELLLSKDIYRFVLILPNRNDSTNLNIISWLPFRDGHCGDYFYNTFKVGSCVDGRLISFRNLFPNPLVPKYNNCIVRVKPIVWEPFVMVSDKTGTFEGLEVNLVELIGEILHLKIDYSHKSDTSRREEVIEHEVYLDAVKELVNGTMDIILGSIRASKYRLTYFDVSVPYYQETALWCVPKARYTADWQLIINNKIIHLFCITFTLLILISCIFYLMRDSRRRSWLYYALNLCSLSFAVSSIMQLKSVKLRMLLIVWVLYNMSLNVLFSTNLMSVMTYKPTMDKIETVDQILQSDLKIKFFYQYSHIFGGPNDTKVNGVPVKWGECQNSQECLEDVALDRDTALTTPKLYFQYHSGKYVDEDSKPLIHCLERNIIATYYVHLIFRKRFVFRAQFDNLLLLIQASGIINLWKSEIIHLKDLGNPRYTKEQAKIGLNHLITVFGVLSIGLFLATSAFVVELFMASERRRRRRKH